MVKIASMKHTLHAWCSTKFQAEATINSLSLGVSVRMSFVGGGTHSGRMHPRLTHFGRVQRLKHANGGRTTTSSACSPCQGLALGNERCSSRIMSIVAWR